MPAGDPPYTFVTDGVEAAIEQARAAADGGDVQLMGASIVQQAIRAGLLDELVINLVPVVRAAASVCSTTSTPAASSSSSSASMHRA